MRSPKGRYQSRYQSRLLNFLNQQGQKLRDQAGQSLRQWKVSVGWGAQLTAQILLYPIQALREAVSRSVSRSVSFLMPGNMSENAIVPDDLPSDLAIQQVLSPDSAAIQAIIASGVMITSGLQVQGIASDRTTQTLCLITTDNQPLSIGAEQQQLLHDHIATALAYYWELWQQYLKRPRRGTGFLKFIWAALPPGLAALVSHSGVTIVDRLVPASLQAPVHFSQQIQDQIPGSTSNVLSPAIDRPNTLTWSNIFSPTTTWIDTPAEAVGYVQHPLEILLGWLDRGLVWLEQGLVWLQNLLKKN